MISFSFYSKHLKKKKKINKLRKKAFTLSHFKNKPVFFFLGVYMIKQCQDTLEIRKKMSGKKVIQIWLEGTLFFSMKLAVNSLESSRQVRSNSTNFSWLFFPFQSGFKVFSCQSEMGVLTSWPLVSADTPIWEWPFGSINTIPGACPHHIRIYLQNIQIQFFFAIIFWFTNWKGDFLC